MKSQHGLIRWKRLLLRLKSNYPFTVIMKNLIEIADRELLTSLFYTDYSLLNGQMGVTIFFALLSKKLKNQWYEEFGDELMENIVNNINDTIPINFGYGICGIGWGIEFLKYKGFYEDETDILLSELDKFIMERDMRRICDTSLETGLSGIYSYIICRLHTFSKNNRSCPFNELYLKELKESMIRLKLPIDENIYSVEKTWEKCVAYYSGSQCNNWKKGLTIIERYG